MGVNKLQQLLNTYAKNVIFEKDLKEYKNNIVAVDTSIMLYQFFSAMVGIELKTSTNIQTSHIYGMVNKILMMLKNKTYPIFVFDGKPPKMKLDKLNARKQIKENAKYKLENNEYDNIIDKHKLLKQTITITNEQIDDCKQIIELFGLPYINAIGEADPQCAYLVRAGIAKFTISEDMDLLAFGSNLLRNFGNTTKTKKIVQMNIDLILKQMNISMTQFIDICILLGTDYNESIKNIGVKRAFHIIKKYSTIENFLEHEKDKYEIPELFIENYKTIREYFLHPPNIIVYTPFKWNEPKYEDLNNILKNKFEFGNKKIETLVSTLHKCYSDFATS